MEKYPRFLALFAFLFFVPFLVAWSPHVQPPSEPAPEAKKKVEFVCQSTGEINATANGETLYLETLCMERWPPPDRGPVIKRVADKVVQRVENSKGPANVFRVPFERTVITVAMRRGKPIVKVHYQDEKGAFHNLRLQPRKGEKYRYDFSRLVLDPTTGKTTIRAESEVREMELL